MQNTLRLEPGEEGRLVVEKIAESHRDERRLDRIRRNLAIVNRLAPELRQQLVRSQNGALVLEARKGASDQLLAAFERDSQSRWVLPSLSRLLDLLQSAPVTKAARMAGRARDLAELATLFWRVPGLPWRALFMLSHHTLRSKEWVLTHGDFTTCNIVVDYESESCSLIDWEELGMRPLLTDEFHLAFHDCVALDALTWQTGFLRSRVLKAASRVSPSALRGVALESLVGFYGLEVRFPGRLPDPSKASARAAVRRRNIDLVLDEGKWAAWAGKLRGEGLRLGVGEREQS